MIRPLLAAAMMILPTAMAAAEEGWAAIEAAGRERPVVFAAWGGSPQINDYIAWAGERLEASHGIDLVHVPLAETPEAVRRLFAEQAAGRDGDGSADLLWINGENFAALKTGGLLYGPFADRIPAAALIDPALPADMDFSIPVEGYEVPWGRAQLTFITDAGRVADPPRDAAALRDFAADHPGRVTYPRPPAFHGTTLLKQLLYALAPDPSVLAAPATPEVFAAATAPLWEYLDALHPHLWRGGGAFPTGIAEMHQMLADGELLLSLTFNPNEAANLIAEGRLPDTAFAFGFDGGTIGNLHFLAIPYNAPNPDGAMVVIDALLSPEAQAHKADIAVWGDPSVLRPDLLPPGATPDGALPPDMPVLPEPHASWVEPLEAAWIGRYGG